MPPFFNIVLKASWLNIYSWLTMESGIESRSSNPTALFPIQRCLTEMLSNLFQITSSYHVYPEEISPSPMVSVTSAEFMFLPLAANRHTDRRPQGDGRRSPEPGCVQRVVMKAAGP